MQKVFSAQPINFTTYNQNSVIAENIY
jgi:hypothetical protein